MRRAVICVGVMLAFVQCWPMVFGRDSGSAAAAPVVARGAVSLTVPPANASSLDPARAASVPMSPIAAGALETCEARYQREVATCRGDGGCGVVALDAHDLCDATGFWPD